MLSRALDAGWGDLTWLESDPVFDGYRSDRAFQEIPRLATERGKLPELFPKDFADTD